MRIEEQQRLCIAGLGNPGKKYVGTRHNLGFLVVQELASQLGWALSDERAYLSKGARGTEEGKELYLLLPQTYMNESGWALKKFLSHHKLHAEQLLIVCDDVALPFGELRLRHAGSSGGHNGLKSAIAHLGSDQFARLRMGIGACKEGWDLAEYVLAEFDAEEKATIDAFIKRGTTVLRHLIKGERPPPPLKR